MEEGNPGHSNDDIIEEATLSLRAASSGTTEASASVLNNASHTRIKNSSFNITTNVFNLNTVHFIFVFLFLTLGILYSLVTASFRPRSRSPDTQREVITDTISGFPASASLDSLYKMVAPNAILNAGGRADENRCHPRTCKKVIRLIESFMDAPVESTPQILWLNAPAGSGKTEIMQTIAERSNERGVPHASFFFSRMDRSRNDATALVATLVYRIIQFSPAIRTAVTAALASNPFLFKMEPREQFDILINKPCFAISLTESPCKPVILLIDALDECDSEKKITQGQVLQALDGVLSRESVPFRLIIASRPERNIVMALAKLRSEVEVVAFEPPEKKWEPQGDIQRFVTEEFNKIKSAHVLGRSLPADWPSAWDVNDIVRRSSGQLIYAATVMRYIKHSPSSPALSLRGVQGIAPPAKDSPFGHLDSLYVYILQQARNPVAVKIYLACTLLAQYPELGPLRTCLSAYPSKFPFDAIFVAIEDLASVGRITPGRDRTDPRPASNFRLYDRSFKDFLQDESKAGDFFIDLHTFSATIFPKFWSAADRHDIAMLILAKTLFEKGIDHHQWLSGHNERQCIPNEIESHSLVLQSLEMIKLIQALGDRDKQLHVEVVEAWGEALDFFLLLETEFHNDQIAFSLVLQAWRYRMAMVTYHYGMSDLKDLFREPPDRYV